MTKEEQTIFAWFKRDIPDFFSEQQERDLLVRQKEIQHRLNKLDQQPPLLYI